MRKFLLCLVLLILVVFSSKSVSAFSELDSRLIMYRALAFEFAENQLVLDNISAKDVYFPTTRDLAYSQTDASLQTKDGQKFNLSRTHDSYGNNLYIVLPQNGSLAGLMFNYDNDGKLVSYERSFKPQDNNLPLIRAIYFNNGNLKKVIVMTSEVEAYFFHANQDFEGHFIDGSIFNEKNERIITQDF